MLRHLVISDWGKKTIEIETDLALEDVLKSHYYHDNKTWERVLPVAHSKPGYNSM